VWASGVHLHAARFFCGWNNRRCEKVQQSLQASTIGGHGDVAAAQRWSAGDPAHGLGGFRNTPKLAPTQSIQTDAATKVVNPSPQKAKTTRQLEADRVVVKILRRSVT